MHIDRFVGVDGVEWQRRDLRHRRARDSRQVDGFSRVQHRKRIIRARCDRFRLVVGRGWRRCECVANRGRFFGDNLGERLEYRRRRLNRLVIDDRRRDER